ncbi:hypothetical protein [Streptomyces sp. MN13]
MTSPAPITAEPVAPVVPLDLAAWTGWLQEQVDPLWRPGEWAQEAWFFNGDMDHPRTRVDKCRTVSCWTLMPARRGFCRHCAEVHRESGLSREEFAEAYQRPHRIRLDRGAERDACVLERDSVRCQRPIYTQDLCRSHYHSYRRRFSQTMSMEEWVASGPAWPFEARPTCIVRGCPNQRVINTFCNPHYQSWDRDRHQGLETGDPEAWASRAATNLRSNQFCLRPLEEAVRWEFLYGLQQRDARGGAIEPGATRLLVSKLAGIPSLLTIEPEDFAAKTMRGNNIVAQFREFTRSLRLASLSFRGMTPTDADLWDLPSLGLKSAGLGGRRQRHGHVDATAIRQPWLREVLKTWAETVSMKNDKFKRTFNACVVASDALHARPGGGQDPPRLRFADMQAVFTAMSQIRRSDNGELTTRKWRMDSFSVFLDLIDFGRKTDMLDGLPGSFNRDKTLILPPEEIIEDAAGKAVPEPVIDQMDAHLALMGAGFPYGEMERADIELMLQTAYLILRDTGRRPIEVPSRSRKYLFPSITDRNGYAHMEASSLPTRCGSGSRRSRCC